MRLILALVAPQPYSTRPGPRSHEDGRVQKRQQLPRRSTPSARAGPTLPDDDNVRPWTSAMHVAARVAAQYFQDTLLGQPRVHWQTVNVPNGNVNSIICASC